MVPGRVLVLGLWAGWIAALLFGRMVTIPFTVHQPPDGIFSACALAGYPKQQDWFRYGLGLVSGPLGAWWAALAWRRHAVAGRWRRGGIEAGAACAGLATLGSFLNAEAGPAIGLVFLVPAVALPWLDRRWSASTPGYSARHLAAVHPLTVVLLSLLSALWVFDSCLLSRSVDGFHEGARLATLQGSLAGDLPGVDARLEYGPLTASLLAWWMRVFPVTIESYRWWFAAGQAAGLALSLVAVRRLTASPVAFGAAATAILGLSSVAGVHYGVPNALRLALPMAALAFADLPLGSGALLGLATMFSPEYGVAAALAWIIGAAGARRPAGDWIRAAAAAAGMSVVLAVAMFGSRWADGLAGVLHGGYGLARLHGHGAMRLPEFPWIGSLTHLPREIDEWGVQVLIWGPGLLAAATMAWSAIRGRNDRGVPWAVFVLLASIPSIARPAGQQANLVPPAAALAAIVIERGLGAVGPARRSAFIGACFLVLLTLQAVRPIALPLVTKLWACGSSLTQPGLPVAGLERLGRVRLPEPELGETRRAVEAIRRWCPAAGRVYLAAPRYAHLPFLADRAALGPIPLTTISATATDRARMQEALEAVRPPVALVTADGLDVPWAVEHAEERAVVIREYRKRATIGDLEVWVRRR